MQASVSICIFGENCSFVFISEEFKRLVVSFVANVEDWIISLKEIGRLFENCWIKFINVCKGDEVARAKAYLSNFFQLWLFIAA